MAAGQSAAETVMLDRIMSSTEVQLILKEKNGGQLNLSPHCGGTFERCLRCTKYRSRPNARLEGSRFTFAQREGCEPALQAVKTNNDVQDLERLLQLF